MAAKVGKPETETSLKQNEITRSRSDPWYADEGAKVSLETHDGASAAYDTAIGRGTVIGRYTLLERLGAGGMATVYSAHDAQLDRIVALKLLRPHEDVAEVRARLIREAQAMARLSHPNVVTVYDVGVASNGRVFLSMEIVGGGTLKAWLRERERSWPAIVKVLCQAGEGLASAHSVGIVHRDFKLENVLIGVDGRPRVTDFGVASVKLSGAGGASATGDHRRSDVAPSPSGTLSSPVTTTEDATIGTPGYMAPEQYDGVEEIDERADIFAFCATLYRALYGECPFEGVSIAEIAAATFSGQVRTAPKGSEVPLWIRRVLLRGLAVDRDARPTSMLVLLAELRADPARRRRRWLAVGAGVLTACAVAWTVHASGQRRARECHEMADRFAGVWDRGRKNAIEGAFRATHLAYAADTWNKIERSLDGYSASWAAATEQACIATRVRGERSEAMLQLQSACLDIRLDELRALSDVFVNADQKTVETAVRATQVLSTIDACTNLDRVSASTQLPTDPATRAEIRTLQGELAAAKALQDAGKPRQSLERLSAVRDRVDRTGFGPLLVSWKMRVASDEAEADVASATADFEEAVLLADKYRLDQAKTEALIGLVRRETSLGHYDQSHRWLAFASAAIARIGGDTRLEALRDISAGWLHVQEGKAAEAVPLFERAIAVARQKHLEDVDLLYAFSGFSTALVALGRFDEGFGTYRAGIELAEEELGPLHPSIVRFFFNNLASDQLDAGRIADALKTASHTVAMLEAAVQRGEALPGSRSLAIARVTLGQALLRSGKAEGAIEQLRLARETFKAAADGLVVVADNELAEAERLLGHTSEANNFLNEASALTASNSGDPLLVGATLAVKAKIALDRGSGVKALALAERALALLEKGPATIYALADARLVVARALRTRRDDGARVRMLARQAREGFATLGDQKRVSEAVALLDENTKR